MKVQELIALLTNECDPDAEIHVYTYGEHGTGSTPVTGVDPYDTVTVLVTDYDDTTTAEPKFMED